MISRSARQKVMATDSILLEDPPRNQMLKVIEINDYAMSASADILVSQLYLSKLVWKT